MPHQTKKEANRAFTLIELLVVIAIIAILAALLLTGVQSAICHSKRSDADTTINQLRTALEMYKSDHGRYPPETTSADSPPLVTYLTRRSNQGTTYYSFRDRQIKKKGGTRHYYSRFGFDDPAYEFHYALPRAKEYKNRWNYTPSGPDPSPSKMNDFKPNLWTAGCDYNASSPSPTVDSVNNYE